MQPGDNVFSYGKTSTIMAHPYRRLLIPFLLIIVSIPFLYGVYISEWAIFNLRSYMLSASENRPESEYRSLFTRQANHPGQVITVTENPLCPPLNAT
ncbi:hypothetical protein FRB91_008591, partial [Serendipita sp. 411]